MVKVSKKLLGQIDEGSELEINGVILEVISAEFEVSVDRSSDEIEVDEVGKTIFLKNESGDEFHLYLPLKGRNLVFERIKRKYISTPWEYQILEKIKVKNFALKK